VTVLIGIVRPAASRTALIALERTRHYSPSSIGYPSSSLGTRAFFFFLTFSPSIRSVSSISSPPIHCHEGVGLIGLEGGCFPPAFFCSPVGSRGRHMGRWGCPCSALPSDLGYRRRRFLLLESLDFLASYSGEFLLLSSMPFA